MPRPALFFFNEQDAHQLAATFAPTVVTQLGLLRAGVSMGLRDLSPERVDVVRRLNAARVPVTAWLLLPRDEGYFATHTNAAQVEAAYGRLVDWSREHELRFAGVGLDFEPDLRDLDVLMARPVRTFARWLVSRRHAPHLEAALTDYRRLIARMRADGFLVETYQFPMLLDDRRQRSRLWQGVLGALELEADREVLMLYTSLMGFAGPALLASYAAHARAVAVGSTGGGIDPFPKLTWAELERDLVVAARHATELFIFSLEGCVEQQFLARLVTVEWDRAVVEPPAPHRVVATGVRFAAQHLGRWLGTKERRR